jgi:hypothetical protein
LVKGSTAVIVYWPPSSKAESNRVGFAGMPFRYQEGAIRPVFEADRSRGCIITQQ